jgi:hypothetical protein
MRRALSVAAMSLGVAGCGVAYAQSEPVTDAGNVQPPASEAGVDPAPVVHDVGSADGGGVTRAAPASVDDADGIDSLLLDGRCKTAICLKAFNQKNWLGIEPLIELPIGKTFTFNTGGLADFVNNNDFSVRFTAGLRVWLFKDWVSLAIYLSQPVTPKDSHVRITGSEFSYPATYVRRPYPGFALGFLFDVMWLGIDRDELRNGTTDDTSVRDASFPRNALVSGAWTFTLAFQPFTSFRTGIGTVLSKQATDQKKAIEEENRKLKARNDELEARLDAGAPKP